MIDFLVNNLDFVLTFIVVVIVCIIMARRGQIKKIKEIVLALCVNAEITYGGGTGAIKKSSVIEAIYDLLPGWAKVFISDKTISDLVEEGKAKMDELANSNIMVNNLLYDVLIDDVYEDFAEEPEVDSGDEDGNI